jgi:hypothetical protein
MAQRTPSENTMVAKIAAQARWARCQDRSAATAPARDGLAARFEDEVDPDRTLPPGERAYRAECAKKAFYLRLALKSAVSRRKARALVADAEVAENALVGAVSSLNQ